MGWLVPMGHPWFIPPRNTCGGGCRGPDAAPFRWTRLPALATRIPGRDPRWSRGTARDFTRIRQRAESPQLGNTLW